MPTAALARGSGAALVCIDLSGGVTRLNLWETSEGLGPVETSRRWDEVLIVGER